MDWLFKIGKVWREHRWGRARQHKVINVPWKGWDDANRIGILFNASYDRMDLEVLREVVQVLKQEHKSVTLCGWTGQMRPKNVLYNGRQLIFIDDFTWRGAPESGNALEFMQTEFDVIVSLHRGSRTPIDDLASKTSAGIRVAGEGEEDFYDFCMRSESRDYSVYFQNLKEWLRKINPSL